MRGQNGTIAEQDWTEVAAQSDAESESTVAAAECDNTRLPNNVVADNSAGSVVITNDPVYNAVGPDDLVIISSDNIRFRIADIDVNFKSKAWNAACKRQGSLTTMHLTDEGIETAEILRKFLKLAKLGELPHDPSQYWSPMYLVQFLVKWDLKLHLRLAMLLLREWLSSPHMNLAVVFMSGATGGDKETCARALTLHTATWDGEVKDPRSHCYGGKNVWDMNTWSLFMRSKLPCEYATALGHAYSAVGASTKLSAKFLYYLELLEKSPASGE